MENEQKHDLEHRMCDWCGNEYGRKYRWLRLIVAILIGLFIFSAGYHLGELNVLVHMQYGNAQTMPTRWHNRDNGLMIPADDNGTTTTIVVPSNPVTPTTPAPQQ